MKLRLLAAGLFFTLLLDANAATRTWDGGGGNNSWNQEANWSDDTLPGPDDDVVFSASVGVIVTESVQIRGLAMGPGSGLEVTGEGVTFVSTGETILDYANLLVSAGAHLSLPKLIGATGGSTGTNFRATGANSVLSLPNLTQMIAPGGYFGAAAELGGLVQLPALSATSGSVVFEAGGNGSRLELDSLEVFVAPGPNAGFYAKTGGTLVTPQLEEVEGAVISLEAGSAMDTSKIFSLKRVSLTVSGFEAQFPALAGLDFVSIEVNRGGRLVLPQIVGASGGGTGTTFLATGQNSVLSLPNLKQMIASGGFGVYAEKAGLVQLPALTTTTGTIGFIVGDVNSRIELDSLVAPGPGTRFEAKVDGTLVTPRLKSVESASLSLEKGGVMDLSQIVSLKNVGLTVSGLEAEFPVLTELDGAGIQVSSGGRLAFPLVTEVRFSPNGYRVSGLGSVLSFPALPRFTAESGLYQVTAEGGGVLNAPRLGHIQRVALQLRDRSTMNVGTEVGALTVTEGICEIAGRSTLNTTKLVLGPKSTLLGGGTLNGSVTNSGLVQIPDPQAKLTVTGDFVQTAEGTLEFFLSSLRPPGSQVQVEVSGSAILGGKLIQNRLVGFSGRVGDSYRMITFGAGSGSFEEFNSYTAENGRQFTPVYGPTSFSLDVAIPGPVFSIDYMLAAENQEFEGKDVVVNGGTLVVDGPHKFRSLRVDGGAVSCPEFRLTNGVAVGGRLDLEIEANLTVHAKGRIHADGKGFPERSGPGAPPEASVLAGAGHGGWGGIARIGDLGGAPYGSMTFPIELGSGGGAADAFGGGAVHLQVGGILRLDGVLAADGGGTGVGGAGGSLLVEANTLSGSGAMSARGGNSNRSHATGAGGGGRIAVLVANIQDFDIRNIQAANGKSDVPLSDSDGDPGTVFFSVDGKESVDAAELTLDGPSYQGVLGSNFQQYFALHVPEGRTVKVSLDHSSTTAATELFASFDRPPSLSQSEFISGDAGKPDQSLVIPGTRAGTYYFLARVASGAQDKRNFNLKAETLPFGVDGVEPKTVGSQIATLRVTGAAFKPGTKFTLRGEANGAVIEALSVAFENDSLAKVAFDLRTASPGEYLLVVTREASEVVAPDPIRVEEAAVVKGSITLTPHPGLRRGRPGQSQLVIENTGNTDIEMAVVTLTCENHPDIALAIPDFDIGSFIRDGVNQVAEFGVVQVAAGERVAIPVVATIGPGFPNGAISIGYSVRFFTRNEVKDWALGAASRARVSILNNPNAPADLKTELADESIFQMNTQTQYSLTGLQSSAVRRAWVVFKYGSSLSAFTTPRRLRPMGYLDGFGDSWPIPILHPLPTKSPSPGTGELAPTGGRVVGSWTTGISSPRSVDPNSKLGLAGTGESRWVSQSAQLPYVVHFENLPSATAPAAEVWVEDILDPDLDLGTFRLGDIQIGAITVDVPAGRSSFAGRVDLLAPRGVYVDIEAGLDAVTRKAYWKFTSIDPDTGLLPESALVGFLPPNDVSGAGEGAVQYSVRPLADIPSGTVITNQASIVFDLNAPLLTEVVTNTVDATVPTSLLNRVGDERGVENPVKIAAVGDDSEGSGLGGILVYVSDDGGPYQAWQSFGSEPLAFEGAIGHSYRLFSVATDQVGNEEPIPEVPDLVLTFPPSIRISLDASTGKVRLSWPGSAQGYTAQKAVALGGTYEAIVTPALLVGDEWVVELETSVVESYIRLKKD